jgi:hypothetical protein
LLVLPPSPYPKLSHNSARAGNLFGLGYTPIIASPDLTPLFGPMQPDEAVEVLAELVKADKAIVRLSDAFEPSERRNYEDVETKNRLGLETTYAPEIDGCLSTYADFQDDNGTRVNSGTDVMFNIDRAATSSSERRWLVATRAVSNCDRRHCPTDPHEMWAVAAEAASPLEAAAILIRQINDLEQGFRLSQKLRGASSATLTAERRS